MVRIHYYVSGKKSLCNSPIAPSYRMTRDKVRVTCPNCLEKLGYEDLSDNINLINDFYKILAEYFNIPECDSEYDYQLRILQKIIDKNM